MGKLNVGILLGDVQEGDVIKVFDHGQLQVVTVEMMDSKACIWVLVGDGERMLCTLNTATPVILVHRDPPPGFTGAELQFAAHQVISRLGRRIINQATLSEVKDAIVQWELSYPAATPLVV